MTRKNRILIADDHAVVRAGIIQWLSMHEDMEVVGEAEDGDKAWKQAKDLKPDVLLLDISMPKMTGLQVAERVKTVCPQVKVIILSAYQDEAHVRQLLASGARGYVLKRTIAEELAGAIRNVVRGGYHLDAHIANNVVKGYVDPSHVSGEASLTAREREIALLMAWGQSNKEIAKTLHLSVKTVESHKARIMQKLDLQSRTELVRYAVRHGWLKQD